MSFCTCHENLKFMQLKLNKILHFTINCELNSIGLWKIKSKWNFQTYSGSSPLFMALCRNCCFCLSFSWIICGCIRHTKKERKKKCFSEVTNCILFFRAQCTILPSSPSIYIQSLKSLFWDSDTISNIFYYLWF